MSQEDLAKATGVSQPAISNLFTRGNRPQQRTIGKFAQALKVEVSDLWPTTVESVAANKDENNPN
jgi:transcriptional regulator with XRE-family HTH domain